MKPNLPLEPFANARLLDPRVDRLDTAWAQVPMTYYRSPALNLSVLTLCVACSSSVADHSGAGGVAAATTGGASMGRPSSASGGASGELKASTSSGGSNPTGSLELGGTNTPGGATTRVVTGGAGMVSSQGTALATGGTLATQSGLGLGGESGNGGTVALGGSSVTTGGTTSVSGSATTTAAGGASQTRAVKFLVEPTFVGNDNPAVPQLGILRLQTDVAADVRVTVSGGDESWQLDYAAVTTLDTPVAGLKPDTTYQVVVSVNAGANTLNAGPLEWKTPRLPDDFPPIHVALSVPTEMEPGMTLFAPRDGWNMTQAPIIIVDHAGIVRWYFADRTNRVQEDLRRLKNGNFLFGRDFCSLREVDIRGRIVGMWHAANYPRTCDIPSGSVAVPVNDFHHDSSELTNGNFLVLSTESRTVEGFPTSEDDANAPKQSALVLGSAVVEFTRLGEVVKRISLLDLLDPTRIGRDSLDTSWPSLHVTSGKRARDWDHANAVIYDETSDSYYVSLRHQDAVIKVNRTTESLDWILGTPANWKSPWSDKLLTPIGDLQWPFHQHAVEINSLGLGMYDNGNYRAAAYEAYDSTQRQYSRAVAYRVDEQAHTVEQVWSYGPATGPDSFYAEGMGDADWQPQTRNVLIDNAQILEQSADPLSSGTTYAQFLEVKPDGTRVFDLTVRGEPGSAYPVYRADRIPDIRR